jgi:hypothetical protein
MLLGLGLMATARAQNREKYLISAKAGGVNYVAGNVKVLRKGDDRQQSLTETDDLGSGDIVTTGAGGRVEVLLNPGSYMRVDENSEFELTDASLDNLQVRLIRGSAVVEATGSDDVELALKINTPQTEALIVKGGIYRFNVLPGETTEILVRKGRLLYGRGLGNEVKGGRKVIIRRGGIEVVKFNKKDEDALDLWSKERAGLLARANRRLERDTLLAVFNDYDVNAYNGYDSNRRGHHERLGFWVYNRDTRSHCFVPVGNRGGSSPYGHNYGNGVGGGNHDRGRDNGGGRWSRGNGGGGGSTGGSSGGDSGSGSSGSSGGGGSSESSGNSGGGNNGGGGDSQPAPAPAPERAPEPPQVSAPSPPPSPPPAPSNDGASDRQMQREDNSRPNR